MRVELQSVFWAYLTACGHWKRKVPAHHPLPPLSLARCCLFPCPAGFQFTTVNLPPQKNPGGKKNIQAKSLRRTFSAGLVNWIVPKKYPVSWHSWGSVREWQELEKMGQHNSPLPQPWEVRLAKFPCVMPTWEAAEEVGKGDEEIGWGPWGKWPGKRGREFRKEFSGNKKTVYVLVKR